MQHKTNLIKVAIYAAGGREKVGKALNVHPVTVTHWTRRRTVPTDKLRALCALSGNVITPEQLITFIEDSAAERVAA